MLQRPQTAAPALTIQGYSPSHSPEKTERDLFFRTSVKSRQAAQPNAESHIDSEVSIHISEVKKFSRVSSANRFTRSPPRQTPYDFQLDRSLVDIINPTSYLARGFNEEPKLQLLKLIEKNEENSAKRATIIKKKELDRRYYQSIISKRAVKTNTQKQN